MYHSLRLLLVIYKTRNIGMVNGMWGMQEILGMFTRILGNPLEDSEECYHFSIPVNVLEDFGEFCWRFAGMLKRIPGNAIKDSRECSTEFWDYYDRKLYQKNKICHISYSGNDKHRNQIFDKGSLFFWEKIPVIL